MDERLNEIRGWPVYEQIKKLAESATEGSWYSRHDHLGNWSVGSYIANDFVPVTGDDLSQEDAEYIAAVSPTAVVEIITRLENAEAEIDRLRALMPSDAELAVIRDVFEDESLEANKARRDWMLAGWSWFERLDAARKELPR